MLLLIKRSFLITVSLGVLLCGVYPVVVTLLAQLFFPGQANGSLIEKNGNKVGSALIGQVFSQPKYFHGRPSAAGDGYDAKNSSPANLGPTSKKLVERLQGDIDKLLKQNPTTKKGGIPTDLATSSGSGLDPDISVESALFQVAAVAKAKGRSEASLREQIAKQTEHPFLGFLGEERVNVLKLNLALDALQE
jgi:K+-transporting ATPase ATPase C chain